MYYTYKSVDHKLVGTLERVIIFFGRILRVQHHRQDTPKKPNIILWPQTTEMLIWFDKEDEWNVNRYYVLWIIIP